MSPLTTERPYRMRPQDVTFHNIYSIQTQVLASEARGDVTDTTTGVKHPGPRRESQRLVLGVFHSLQSAIDWGNGQFVLGL